MLKYITVKIKQRSKALAKKILILLLALVLTLGAISSLVSCTTGANDPCAEHTDADGNGKCDVCKTKVGTNSNACLHADTDRNGICDSCGEPYRCGHIDRTGDDLCDKCGISFAEIAEPCPHRDANDDGICDRCAAEFSDGEDCQHKDEDDNGICDNDGCGEAYSDGTDTFYYEREGNTVYFGSYPQTEIKDAATISALNKLSDPTPDEFDDRAWTSYGYYMCGDEESFTWYIDVEYNGEKYRGVHFSDFRPADCTAESNQENSYQDDNGYSIGWTYWFKYEPIKWAVVSESKSRALIVAVSVIDSMQFSYDGQMQSNNYAESTVRAWLNDVFYETAFSELEAKMILTATVDNSLASTMDAANSYVCENTEDNVFLLSRQEYVQYLGTDGGAAKRATAYAKSLGVTVSAGRSWWLLRSPYNVSGENVVHGVDADGLGAAYCTEYSNIGIVPALYITLK